MGLFDLAFPISKPLQKTSNWVDSKVTQLPDWAEKPAKIALLSSGAGQAARLNTEIRNWLGLNGSSNGAGGDEYPNWYAPQGFPMVEFTPIEPLGEIDVNALLDEMAGINRKATETNFGIAQTMGRQVADNAFTDFTAFLDKVLPEAGNLTKSVAREAQNFIDRGLPSAVMGNAILRDSAMFAATGTRGGVAVRRGLANEAARDTQAVQYGMGVAQQLVNDARSTALPFAQLGAEATMSNLGLLSQLTTITPAQRIGMAFDERNYVTGVMQFNSTGQANMSIQNAQLGLAQQQFGFQQYQFQTEMAMQQELQREQQRAAQKAQQAALWSTLGTVGGAAAGFAIGGPAGAMMGAQIGGGLGQVAAGQQTGNYALVSQGLTTGMGAYGTYNSWQSQQQQVQMQKDVLEMYKTGFGRPTPFYGWAGNGTYSGPYSTGPFVPYGSYQGRSAPMTSADYWGNRK